MTVSQRLYLAVVPGIVGIFAVAGLAYWGQYGRQAPDVLVIVAVVAAVASLLVAWWSTRYVASRVTRLAAPGFAGQRDELDAIEGEVDRLRAAVAVAQADEATATQHAEAAIREYGGLVADTATTAARQLDDVRMPLHILLENRFGDLNENQEEMVAAARAAADEAQDYLARLCEIADLDREALRLRSERVRLSDVIAALFPGLRAEAARAGIRIASDLPPFLAPVCADRVRLSEAIALLTTDAVRRTPPGGEVRITANADDAAKRGVQIRLAHGSGPARQTDVALANRLIVALGGRVDYAADQTIVTLPAYVGPIAPPVDPAAERSQPSR